MFIYLFTRPQLIQLITGDKNIKIGHNVQSETSQISFAKYHKEDGLCVTLIDTPGFDDSREGETDVVVLKKIASFRFINGKKFKGIIYLHRITDPRIGGVAARNLRMFKQLCGPSALGNVVVVTTLWDRIKEEEGMRREQDLMTNPKFFRPFAEAGAHFQPSFKSRKSWRTVSHLKIQRLVLSSIRRSTLSLRNTKMRWKLYETKWRTRSPRMTTY